MTKKMPLSDEQEIAAEPTRNVWVQANAGTGKTSVLTERLLRILFRSDDNMGGILCLTYTNAAAGEMRNRILAALREWAMADDETLRDLLQGIATNIPPSDADIEHARRIFFYYIDNPEILKIKTIHGFCEEILHRFPTEAGISPSWVLISDAPQKVLLYDALNKMVNSGTIDTGTAGALEHIIGLISEYRMDKLLEYIGQQYKNFFHITDIIKYRNYFIDTITKKLNLHTAKTSVFSVNNLKTIVELSESEKKPTKTLTNLINTTNQYIDNTIDFEEYKKCYLTGKGTLKAGLNYNYLEDEKKRVYEQNIYDINKKICDDTIALFDISATFAKTYQELKQARNVLDFDDLILYTHRLFSNPETMGWILSQLDLSLSHILVDEAQDTGPLQWDILRMLAGDFFAEGDRSNLPRSLFVVGDTKQSIYGFQGADPNAFASSREEIANYITNNARQIYETPLTQSFRSTAPILNVVDTFFSNPNVKALTGFMNNKHKCFRTNAKGLVEIHNILSAADDNTSVVRRKYVCNITDKIENLIKTHKCAPHDIMILVQKRDTLVNLISSELKHRGIAVAGSDRIVLPKFPIIKDLMNLLRFCINNADDYSLGCVLKSPIFRLSETDIYTMCTARNKKTLQLRTKDKSAPRANLINFLQNSHPDIYSALTDFVRLSKSAGPYTFFTYVLNHHDIRAHMIAALGTQVIDPLEEFITICLAYERTRPGTLRHFIKWFITGGSEVKRDMDSSNGVRIVTVHGSKGLQSKCVFLVDTTSMPKHESIYNIKNDELPNNNYPVWIWIATKPDGFSPEFSEIESATSRTMIEESFRLLYVAMTRACDELYIYGFTTNKAANELSWHGLLWNTLSRQPGIEIKNDTIKVSNYEQ